MGLAPWRHRVTIWRASPNLGELDPDLGTFTIPDGRWEIFKGRAMVQAKGPREVRTATGQSLDSDADVIIEDPRREFINLVRTGDQVDVVNPDGTTGDASVVRSIELSATVEVKYL